MNALTPQRRTLRAQLITMALWCLAGLLAALTLTVVAVAQNATPIANLSRTNIVRGTNLIAIVAHPGQTNGTRAVPVAVLLSNLLTGQITIGTNNGVLWFTNGVLTLVTNGASGQFFTYGSAGPYWSTVAPGGGSGSTETQWLPDQTQFFTNASGVFVIRSAARLTNAVLWGTTSSETLYVTNGIITTGPLVGSGGGTLSGTWTFSGTVDGTSTNFISSLAEDTGPQATDYTWVEDRSGAQLVKVQLGAIYFAAANWLTNWANSISNLTATKQAGAANLTNWGNIATGAMANVTAATFLTNQITTASNAVMSQIMTASNSVYTYTDTAASNRVRLQGGTGGITVSQSGSGGVQTWTINDDDAGGGASTNLTTLAAGSLTTGTLIATQRVQTGLLEVGTNARVANLTATNWVQVNGPQTNSAAVYATSTLNVDGVVSLGSDLNVPSGTIAGSTITASSEIQNSGRRVETIDKVGATISIGAGNGPLYSIATNQTVTLTFSGTAQHGQRLSLMVSNTATTNWVVGLPTVYSPQVRSNVTGWVVAASNYVVLPFLRTTNEVGGGIWLLERMTELDATVTVASAGANGFLSMLTNAAGDLVTISNTYLPQASSIQLSNVAASAATFATSGQISNLTALKFAVHQPSVASSNLVLSFGTNRVECVGLTNLVLTNLVEEASAISADMTVVVRATTGNTTLVWPSYGAQHGYFLRTNQNNYVLGWAAVTNGKAAVISFSAFGTNIFATITEWP